MPGRRNARLQVLAAQRHVKRRAHGTTGRALSGCSSRCRSSSAVPTSAGLSSEHRRIITDVARQREPGVHVSELMGQADACRLPSLPAPASRSPQRPADLTVESNARPICGSWRQGATQCHRDSVVEQGRPFQNGTQLFGYETRGMAPAGRTASRRAPGDDARRCSLAWRSSTSSAGRPDSLLMPVDYFRHRLPSLLSPRRPTNSALCT